MKTLLAKHRSIRKFRSEPIAPEVLQDMLEAASRASTCGNMQLYSLIVTQSRELREALAPCHFNQPMVTQAPCVITVCADVHRFSMWCEQRDAEPCYDNFAWFLNGVTDALLAAQNLCVEAEAHGLGICYLGTTIYTAEEIARILDLPKGVIPVTTIVVGHPDESPELTDRLPLDAVVHCEKYHHYTSSEIDELWAEKETSEETRRLLEENGLPNLAQIFTRNRYRAEDNLAISRNYFALLKNRVSSTINGSLETVAGHIRLLLAVLAGVSCSVTRKLPEESYLVQKVTVEADKETPKKSVFRLPTCGNSSVRIRINGSWDSIFTSGFMSRPIPKRIIGGTGSNGVSAKRPCCWI